MLQSPSPPRNLKKTKYTGRLFPDHPPTPPPPHKGGALLQAISAGLWIASTRPARPMCRGALFGRGVRPNYSLLAQVPKIPGRPGLHSFMHVAKTQTMCRGCVLSFYLCCVMLRQYANLHLLTRPYCAWPVLKANHIPGCVSRCAFESPAVLTCFRLMTLLVVLCSSACHCEHAFCTCCAARSRVDPQAFQLVSQQLRATSACLSQNFAPPSRRKEGCGLVFFFVCQGVCVFVPSTECHCSFTCKACSFRICLFFFVCQGVCVFVPSTECHCSFTCKACSFRICPTLSASWLEKKVRRVRGFQSVHG